MKVINTIDDLPIKLKSGGHFDLSEWEKYIDTCVPGGKDKCLNDMKACGMSWEDDILPVLENACANSTKRNEAVSVFTKVTAGLDARINAVFGRTLDADIYLYLGLCNGAGWVTDLGGRTTVLIGIEKVMELDWCDEDHMNGLILHELGHVYQGQYGRLKTDTSTTHDRFIWQLFTEGVAMVFEQELVGDKEYFHQDKDGWKKWCDENFTYIADTFRKELPQMTRENQRYFGDWVSFEGRADVGYYLGTRFVRFMLEKEDFDNIICYDIERVKYKFDGFIGENICKKQER